MFLNESFSADLCSLRVFSEVADTFNLRYIPFKAIFASTSGKRPNEFTKEESQKLLSAEQLDATLQLLFYASKGDVGGIQAMTAKNTDVKAADFENTDVKAADFDQRTALHMAACENLNKVVKVLIEKWADVNAEDRCCSTVPWVAVDVYRLHRVERLAIATESRRSRITSLMGSEVGEVIADPYLTPKDESSRLSNVEGLTWMTYYIHVTAVDCFSTETQDMSYAGCFLISNCPTFPIPSRDMTHSYVIETRPVGFPVDCAATSCDHTRELRQIDFDRKSVPCFKV
ncbi:hypothetical protein MPTK1_4g09560 [Marchantia polymorpha subsp. ruderalis]|uniref:ANK_REP_REGION domain-containing protein n=2 Tax=Marchantia polymorpha TaxID=3197 RepID=A0AAF6B853_MARPO|nr:hypothetical protein MARPO_0112s0061 [Marchantia polymorpha]BBN08187.1 hypothetical protein Mp_4g09560 [Marchantia polymorpha subsp. ruderalis]|eukprot:PTQ31421.1 hypothetical protein MARPO_0112s0061 [Marchantia polymorpha]